MILQLLEHALQVGGQRAREVQSPSVGGMRERQAGRVQERPLEVRHRPEVAWHTPMHTAVERIADDRMADGAQVHANLVRAPGVNRDGRERQQPAEVLRGDDARDRFAAAAHAVRIARRLRGRHLLAVHGVASDGRVDAAPRHHLAPHQCDVLLFNLAILKLPGQRVVRGVVLGDDDQAGRPAIEAVHDARTFLAADAAQVVEVMEQRVDERAARVSGRRMHDHAGRLVDDGEIPILIHDGERQRFRLRRRIGRLGDVDGDRLRRLDALIRFRGPSVHEDVPVCNQPLDLRPRPICKNGGQKTIEPVDIASRRVVRHGDGHAAFLASFGSGVIALDR